MSTTPQYGSLSVADHNGICHQGKVIMPFIRCTLMFHVRPQWPQNAALFDVIIHTHRVSDWEKAKLIATAQA